MKSTIPMYPAAFKSPLLIEEQNCLSYYVISGCKREDAFTAFVNPALKINSATLKKVTDQFFSSKDAKEYIEAYTQTLEAVLHPQPKPQSEKTSEERKRDKENALNRLVDYVTERASHIDTANEDEREQILKFADKIGLLGEGEEHVEAPRRYLPVSCRTECRYRLFVEENAEDECKYCKYKKYGEENGLHFENEKMLDIPVNIVE